MEESANKPFTSLDYLCDDRLRFLCNRLIWS